MLTYLSLKRVKNFQNFSGVQLSHSDATEVRPLVVQQRQSRPELMGSEGGVGRKRDGLNIEFKSLGKFGNLKKKNDTNEFTYKTQIDPQR